jgi:hypothetical protein
MHFDWHFNLLDPKSAEGLEQCMLHDIGQCFAWIFKPLGFGCWQATVACASAEIAKEQATATLALLSPDVAGGTIKGIQVLFADMVPASWSAIYSFHPAWGPLRPPGARWGAQSGAVSPLASNCLSAILWRWFASDLVSSSMRAHPSVLARLPPFSSFWQFCTPFSVLRQRQGFSQWGALCAPQEFEITSASKVNREFCL